MPTDDHLSNEIGVEVVITETGLKAKAKSRAIAAFDRLLGNMLDVWNAGREAKAGYIRERSRIDAAAERAVVARIEAAADGGDADAARLVEQIAISEIRAVANKAHVVDRAVEQLAATASSGEPDSEADEIDPDWLNHFESHAEKATSEKVRDLWARVLAGEIRHPGAFSLMTLRVLAELDRQMAQWFQDAVELRIHGRLVIRPKRELEELTGERWVRLTFLEQVGLFQHVIPFTSDTWTLEPNASGFAAVVEGDYCLRVQVGAPVGVRVIPITRVGQQIALILPKVDPIAALKNLAEALSDEAQSMYLHRVLSSPGRRRQLSPPIEVLKAPSDED